MMAVLLLSGCGVYSKYESTARIPDNIYGAEKVDNGQSMAQVGWREFFKDECLKSLIDTAFFNSADVQTAMLDIDEAQIMYKTSRLAYLPTLAFSPTGGVSKNANLNEPWQYSLGVTSQWQLDVFGAKITNSRRKAKAELALAQDYEQAVSCRLISAVATLYYQLQCLDKQLDISRQMVSLYEKTSESVHALFEAGHYTSAAVHQTDAELEQLRAEIITLERAINQTEHSICRLLNKPYFLVPRKVSERLELPSSFQVGVPSDILKYRPDVRAAERQMETAFYDVQLSKGNLYPNIAISGNGGWMIPQTWFVQGIGSLTQPIFQGGRLRADLKISRLEQQKAAVNFRKTVIDAVHEIGNALGDCKASAEKMPLLQKQVSALNETVMATQELMNNGTSTYLEVLTALQNLLQAENAEVENYRNGTQAMVALYSALGGH